MADMQVAVRLRRESGADFLIFSLSQIFLYDLFNKVFGNGFLYCLFFQFILLHLWYLSLRTSLSILSNAAGFSYILPESVNI